MTERVLAIDTPDPDTAAQQAAFLAGLKLGDGVRMKGDAMVTGDDYDRVAVVTDVTDGVVTFMVRPRTTQ